MRCGIATTQAELEKPNGQALHPAIRCEARGLRLSHRISPAGEAIAGIGGELDIATADVAVRYVRLVIDRHGGPLIVDLAGLAFCDARGLSALLRMAMHAERAGCPFRLASTRPSLVKLMQVTGLDRRFLLLPSGSPAPTGLPGRPQQAGPRLPGYRVPAAQVPDGLAVLPLDGVFEQVGQMPAGGDAGDVGDPAAGPD